MCNLNGDTKLYDVKFVIAYSFLTTHMKPSTTKNNITEQQFILSTFACKVVNVNIKWNVPV